LARLIRLGGGSLLKKAILIVEDEPSVLALCRAVLSKEGYDCLLAVDGADGLQIYKQKREEICLTLSDISMPVMEGIEMVRRIYEIDSRANVIFMSGYGHSRVPEDFKKHCAFLQKPFTLAQLIEAVKDCLKHGLCVAAALALT
jgi:two-component system, cell cycle sensor histidine kinase and response regulator CckA